MKVAIFDRNLSNDLDNKQLILCIESILVASIKKSAVTNFCNCRF